MMMKAAQAITQNVQVSEFLRDKFSIPGDVAASISVNFLRAFRKCPENTSMDLDGWRHYLWTQALGDVYRPFADEVYIKWLQLRYHYLALKPEILNLLNTLRQHYLLGLITNGPSRAQWEKIQRLDLRAHFDIVLVSGDLPWEKPQTEIFHKACAFLGVKPAQCLMVGDKLETDIRGGIEANLGGTVWIPLANDKGQESQLHPDYVLDDVTGLLGLLPAEPKVLAFRKKKRYGSFSLPDLDDCNSNGSDGS